MTVYRRRRIRSGLALGAVIAGTILAAGLILGLVLTVIVVTW